MLLRWSCVIVFSLFLGSCNLIATPCVNPTLSQCKSQPDPDPKPDPDPNPPTPRPQNTPDIVILGVSGRCSNFGNPPDCTNPPEDNWDYLGSWGTLETLAQSLRNRGKRVEVWSYSSHLTTHTSNDRYAVLNNRQTQQGFLQLEERYKTIFDQWIKGRTNPTQVILVGHSHGVNWTHQLVRAYPNRSFFCLIDLDGISTIWETDHGQAIVRYTGGLGKNPWSIDMQRVEHVYTINGITYDVKDVVPNNVKYDIEVQSTHNVFAGNWLFDAVENVRTNGSRTGISTFESTQEQHNPSAFPNGRGIAWAKEQLSNLPL